MNIRCSAVAAAALALAVPASAQSRPSFALPSGPDTVDVAAALAAATPAAATAAERAERAAQRFAQLDAAAFDLDARAHALGPDPDAAFRLVRDEIGFVSYAGVLRGARLTYAERAGNALDRALLLADLLRRQGHTVRFARGRLPDVRADQVVAAIFAPPRAVPSVTFGKPDLAARVHARATRDLAAVRSALGDARPAPPVAGPAELREEVRDHVWVQVEKDGAWRDLDPSFADVDAGRSVCTAEETWTEVPESLHQRLVVRLVVERVDGERLVAATVLEVDRPAWTWLDEQVFLLHSPLAKLGHGIAGALGGDVASVWMPVLAVGDELIPGEPIDCGTFRRAGALDALSAELGAAASTGADATAGAAAGFVASALVAEWLELELTSPDGRRELHRRALLDRAPPEARAAGTVTAAALAPMPATTDGPAFCRQVHALAFAAGRHDLYAFAEAVVYLTCCLADAESGADAAGGATAVAAGAANTSTSTNAEASGEAAAAGAPSVDDVFAGLWPLMLQTFHAQWFVDHEIVPALADEDGVRLWAESPRVWIASLLPADDGSGWNFLLDLRRDKLRGVARAADQAAAVAERKLWFALLGGAVEHEFLAQAAVEAGVGADAVATTSAFVRAGEVALARATPRHGCATADVANGGRGARQDRWVAASLQRECVVVLPAAEPPTTAFWEIDANGDARAVYGDDWNGAHARVGLRPAPGGIGGWPPKSSLTKGPLNSAVERGSVSTGGRPGGVYEVNPDGTSRPVGNGSGGGGNRGAAPRGRGGPKGPRGPKGKAGGSEYATLLESVTIPNAAAFVGVCAAVAAAIAKALGGF